MKIKTIILIIISTFYIIDCQYFTQMSYKDWKELNGTSNANPILETIYVNGGKMILQDRQVKLSPYRIGKYEVCYERWKYVYDWALKNGYSIANPSQPGKVLTTVYHAACKISWRDVIVWCNAASEMEGLEAVYYIDPGYTVKLKKSDNSPVSDVQGSQDNPFVKWDADGYRLPTEAEWECAARGGNPDDTTSWSYLYAGSNTLGNPYAVYNDPDKEVGSKLPNTLGAYDMSGNMAEFCYDWYDVIGKSYEINPIGPASMPASGGKSYRGGHWYDFDTEEHKVGSRISGMWSPGYTYLSPNDAGSDTIGFRICRTVH